jgi:hypothetical protein
VDRRARINIGGSAGNRTDGLSALNNLAQAENVAVDAREVGDALQVWLKDEEQCKIVAGWLAAAGVDFAFTVDATD